MTDLPTSQPSNATPFKDSAAIAVALLAVTAFGMFIIFLLVRLKLPDLEWTRAIYLLNGVEAIVFAAAGFLFGKEVHRAQAVSAEKRARASDERAEAADKRAEKESENAANGRALAKMLVTVSPENPDGGELREVMLGSNPRERDLSLSDFARVARRLFPDA